jgi:uncharacterized protein YegP (UPF0339 family)
MPENTRPLIVETYSARKALFSTKQEHRWRVRHTANGQIMASGEGYADLRDRDHAVEVLWPDLEVKSLA